MRAVAAACVAAALLAPSVTAAPPRPPRVVSVSVTHATGPPDTATGFVAGDGLVVTVAHVLERGGEVTVDGRRARVVRADPRLDVGLLAVPGLDGAAPRLAGSGGVARLIALGGPRPVRLVRRVRARLDGEAWRRPVLELRADVAAGDSGAPVVTASGRLAGVVFARSQDRAGVAYATDAAALGGLLPR